MNSTGKRNASVTDTSIYSCILLFLLVTVFILPSRFKTVASLLFAGVLFLLVCLQRPCKIAVVKLSPNLIASLLILIAAVLVSICLSAYPKSLMLTYVAFLLLALLVFSERLDLRAENSRSESAFYVLTLCIVVYEVLSHVGAPFPMYVSGAYDKNYLGILLFLFFSWCWATGRKAGVLVCVIAAALIGSRNYVIMIALFVCLELLRARHRSQDKGGSGDDNAFLRPGTIFGIFILMLLGIAVFSFWWSSSVVGSGTAAYQAGMNDSSNAVRFNSDWYAIQHLFKNPSLVLYGYDNDIINAMHIIQSSELNGTESALTGTFYNGFRIVQPHHVILNMILKEGVLFTIGYYAVLACIFSRFFRKGNMAFWAPYLLGCMFMHSLLVSYYLVFLLMVLSRAAANQSHSLTNLFLAHSLPKESAICAKSTWSVK